MNQRRNLMTRRGGTTGGIVGILAILVVLVGGVWLLLPDGDSVETTTASDLFEVRRGGFDITVPASGELAAASQVEIKNRLESRAVITWIVDEGTRVEQGEILLRFNDDDIRTKIDESEDALNVAQNEYDNAVAKLQISQKTRESELAKADLNIELAQLALQSWEDGEHVTTLQELELGVKTAKKEHERAIAILDASRRLLEKEFISKEDFQKDEIALLNAEVALEKSRKKLDVYNDYDEKRNRIEKESDLKSAKDERERSQQRLDAEVRSAESDVESRRRKVDSREERLAKWTRQLELCEIKAPQGGLVVYQSSLRGGRGWRGNDDPPDIGTEVNRNETVIVLPDVSEMIAEVKVNEALMGVIEKGQNATLQSDAHPDTVIEGEVLGVGVLAEGGSWRDPNRRDYTVRIKLIDVDHLGLKPSMRCKADIFVSRVEDATFIPVQAIDYEGRRPFVYASVPGGYEQRQVRVGNVSNLYVEIVDGLAEGDSVLLREPRPAEIVKRLDDAEKPGEGGPGRFAGMGG